MPPGGPDRHRCRSGKPDIQHQHGAHGGAGRTSDRARHQEAHHTHCRQFPHAERCLEVHGRVDPVQRGHMTREKRGVHPADQPDSANQAGQDGSRGSRRDRQDEERRDESCRDCPEPETQERAESPVELSGVAGPQSGRHVHQEQAQREQRAESPEHQPLVDAAPGGATAAAHARTQTARARRKWTPT